MQELQFLLTSMCGTIDGVCSATSLQISSSTRHGKEEASVN